MSNINGVIHSHVRKIAYFVGIVVTLLAAAFSLTPIALDINPKLLSFLAQTEMFYSVQNLAFYCTVMVIVLQIFSTIMGTIYQNETERKVLGKSAKTAIQSISHPRADSSIQEARDELRYGLFILLISALLCCAMFSVKSWNICDLIVAVCILSVSFMYADYLAHAKAYGERYDRFSLKKGQTANSIRGCAKIYLNEYIINNNRFILNKKQYRKLRSFSFSKKDEYQDDCVKAILRMSADSYDTTNRVVSVIITCINCFLLLPRGLDRAIEVIGGFNSVHISPEALHIMAFLINIWFTIINLSAMDKCYEKCDQIRKISEVMELSNTAEGREKRFKVYNKMKDSPHFYEIQSRGIFVFCSYFMDSGERIDEIPLEYKMLYKDRLYANLSRFDTTLWVSTLAIVCLFLEYSVSLTFVCVFMCIFMVVALTYRTFGLQFLGMHRIKKFCKELVQEKNRTGDGSPS